MQEGIDDIRQRLSSASTVTIKGKDGKTPKKGEDYLTDQEMAQLKAEIAQLVLSYLLPKIPNPKDGKTPIPGVDFPTNEQIFNFISSQIEQIRKQKFDRKQIAKDLADYVKDKPGILGWKNIKDIPDWEALVADKIEDKASQIRKEIIKQNEVPWSRIKGKPDFEQMLQGVISGGGPKIRVLDEGTTVSEHFTALNFIGSSVATTYAGDGQINVTISAGSSLSAVDVSGAINGSNTTFTIPSTPTTGILVLHLGRQIQVENTDFTLSGTTITYTVAPPAVLSGEPHKAILY